VTELPGWLTQWLVRSRQPDGVSPGSHLLARQITRGSFLLPQDQRIPARAHSMPDWNLSC
jgi:hypothetical protein